MAGWFKTELPQGSMIPQLIEKGNAFTALSNSMGQMMDVVENRAKEKYTTSALEKLKGVTNPQEMLTAMQGIDYTKLNKEGAGALDRLTKNIQLQDAFKRQGLQDTLTKLQIEKAQQPTETEILNNAFIKAKQSGALPPNITNALAYKEYIKQFGKADTSKPITVYGKDGREYSVTQSQATELINSGQVTTTLPKDMPTESEIATNNIRRGLAALQTVDKEKYGDELRLAGQSLLDSELKAQLEPKDLTAFEKLYEQATSGKTTVDDIIVGEWDKLSPKKQKEYGSIAKYKAIMSDRPTSIETEIAGILEEEDFVKKYSSLSAPDQKKKAMEIARERKSQGTSAGIELTATKGRIRFNKSNEKLSPDDISTKINDLTSDEYTNIKLGEENSDYYKKKYIDLSGTANDVNDMSKQSKVIYDMTSDDWNKGMGQNIINSIRSTLPENWFKQSKEDKIKYLNSIKGQSILGDIFFTYLNKVNKGAPSDADLKLMEKIVTAGQSGNLSATKEALSTFMNTVIDRTQSSYGTAMKKVPLSANQEFNTSKDLNQYKWVRGFYVGKEYTDANGNKAIWNGKSWEEK